MLKELVYQLKKKVALKKAEKRACAEHFYRIYSLLLSSLLSALELFIIYLMNVTLSPTS